MLLSIGMIVKNEEKHLRDCLTALTPILDSVESELIIYDTGSTDSTVEIAKDFTDNVFHIEWRGDFAWARNHPLRKAKGKWFMYIDADEIFEDTEDLIKFFNSRKHRNHNTATIELRNVSKFSNTASSTPRLYKMYKGIRFEGKIHEHIKVQAPIIHLKSKALHYGYNYETLEQIRAKSERNLPLMLEELEASPNDPRLYWHIVNEYNLISYYNEAAKQIELGLSVASPGSPYFDALSFQQIKTYSRQQRPEDVIKAAQNYFEKAKRVQQIAIEIKTMVAEACFNLKRYEEALEAYKQARELYSQNKCGKISEEYGRMFPIETDYLNSDSSGIRGIFNVLVAMGDFNAAKEWVSNHPEEFPNVKRTHIYVQYAMRALGEKDYNKAAHLYEYAIDNFHPESDEFIDAVMPLEKSFNEKEARLAVTEAVVSYAEAKTPPATDDYSMLARLRVMYRHTEPIIKNTLKHFLQKEETINQMYGEVIVYAINTGSDFSTFLENLNITNTDEMCRALNSVEGSLQILLDYMENNVSKETGTKLLRLMGSVANYLLAVACAEKASDDEENTVQQNETKIRLFEAAARLNHRQLKHVYKESIYGENINGMLPERDEFYYFAGTAYERLDAGDHSGFIQNLRRAMILSEQVRDVVKLILVRLEEQIKPPKPESQKSLQDQLRDEISNLKDIIYTAIKARDKDKATMLIGSYAAINPNDPDIPTIRQMIENWITEETS